MIAALLRQITAPETARQLAALAAGAPPSAPVSLCLDLPAQETDWLPLLPAGQPWWYRARPAHGEYRLAIGHALQLGAQGAQRRISP